MSLTAAFTSRPAALTDTERSPLPARDMSTKTHYAMQTMLITIPIDEMKYT